MPSRFWWNNALAAQIGISIPERAHRLAAQQAAGLAAKRIRSKGSGQLARDVARAIPIGPGRSIAGSAKPYARIEHLGGTIKPRKAKRLLIRGNRGGNTRSTVGGEITASAEEVQHEGKGYLDAALISYPKLFTEHLRRMMPK
jgi:hypothetical protein